MSTVQQQYSEIEGRKYCIECWYPKNFIGRRIAQLHYPEAAGVVLVFPCGRKNNSSIDHNSSIDQPQQQRSPQTRTDVNDELLTAGYKKKNCTHCSFVPDSARERCCDAGKASVWYDARRATAMVAEAISSREPNMVVAELCNSVKAEEDLT